MNHQLKNAENTLLRLLAGLIFSFGISSSVSANLILNGDLENNTLGSSAANRTNAEFTAEMNDATGFGTSEELDIITSTDFGIAPQSGDWKVGLHNTPIDGNPFDAFSLNLSSATVIGTPYYLSFYTAGVADTPLVDLQIGLSSSATDFGTLVFSGQATNSASWDFFSTSFVASSFASFLTVRTDPSVRDGYAFVDNISLTIPEPTTLALMGLGLVGIGCRRKTSSS